MAYGRKYNNKLNPVSYKRCYACGNVKKVAPNKFVPNLGPRYPPRGGYRLGFKSKSKR
jgi:hypothetical protein